LSDERFNSNFSSIRPPVKSNGTTCFLAVSSGNRTARRCARYTRLIGCSILYALPLVCVFFRPLNASKINEDATSINQPIRAAKQRDDRCALTSSHGGPEPPSWPHLALSPARARTKERSVFRCAALFACSPRKIRSSNRSTSIGPIKTSRDLDESFVPLRPPGRVHTYT